MQTCEAAVISRFFLSKPVKSARFAQSVKRHGGFEIVGAMVLAGGYLTNPPRLICSLRSVKKQQVFVPAS